MNRIGRFFGRTIAAYLDQPVTTYREYAVTDPALLQSCLRPGDVLLVEGNRRISTAIKYLTQSTWSHAALYIGDTLSKSGKGPAAALIEADLRRGVVTIPLGLYGGFNTRICRPVGLTADDRDRVVNYMIQSLGRQYDLKNVIDLARYLFPTPPVPTRWRRRLIAFGSGDPTRAICSTLIAQAFQSVQFPILPIIDSEEVLHIRHHSLFTPSDFDISPYFEVIKPTICHGFDYKTLKWGGP